MSGKQHYPDVYYDAETDTLDMRLSDGPIAYTYDEAPGVVVSYDKDRRAVLIEFTAPARKLFATLIEQHQKDPQRGLFSFLNR
ncbi:MAG: DUF2283 domain-containing protein [Dehalococcoidia bacterium]